MDGSADDNKSNQRHIYNGKESLARLLVFSLKKNFFANCLYFLYNGEEIQFTHKSIGDNIQEFQFGSRMYINTLFKNIS
jgi:hypothetical protein